MARSAQTVRSPEVRVHGAALVGAGLQPCAPELRRPGTAVSSAWSVYPGPAPAAPAKNDFIQQSQHGGWAGGSQGW